MPVLKTVIDIYFHKKKWLKFSVAISSRFLLALKALFSGMASIYDSGGRKNNNCSIKNDEFNLIMKSQRERF